MKTWNLGYEKSKQKAKGIYSRIGRVASPALNNSFVAFTSLGFTHLVRKGRIPRTRNEQKRRFVLVPYIEQVVKNPQATIEYRSKEIKYYADRHGNKVLITSIAHFWTFSENVDDCKVKVVVRQLNQGQIHFLSVMGDNVIITKRKDYKNKKSSK